MKKLPEDRLALRLVAEPDHKFIFHSLLRSYRGEGFDMVRKIPQELYYTVYQHTVADILKNATGLCAVNPEDDQHIWAYILFEKRAERVPILHYLYVKAPYRNMGLASVLLARMRDYCSHPAHMPVIISHNTKAFERFLKAKAEYLFNPYVVATERSAK